MSTAAERHAWGSGFDAKLDAWQVTLDRIELDVIRAERALATGSELHTDLWEPPADPGLLPLELHARALDILSRQETILQKLSEAVGATARQLAVADAVSSVSPRTPTPAVYVDVSA